MALAQVNLVPLEHIVILMLAKIKFRNAYLVHMATSVMVVLVCSPVIQDVTMVTNVTKVPIRLTTNLVPMVTTVFKAKSDHVTLDHIPLHLELTLIALIFVIYVPLDFTVPVRVSLNYVLQDIIAQRVRSFQDSNVMLASFVLQGLQHKSTVMKVQRLLKFIKANALIVQPVFIVPHATKLLLSTRILITSGKFSN